MKKWNVKVYEKNLELIGSYLVPAPNRREAKAWAILFYAKRSLMESLPTTVEWAWGG